MDTKKCSSRLNPCTSIVFNDPVNIEVNGDLYIELGGCCRHLIKGCNCCFSENDNPNDDPAMDSDILGLEADFTTGQYKRIAGAVNRTAGEDFDEFECFGGRKRCIVADDGKIFAYYGDDAYIETGATETEVTVSGIIMVMTPI